MLRQLLEKNLYLNNFLRSIIMRKFNNRVEKFIDEASKYDSIGNFEDFREFIKNFKNVYSSGIFSVKKSFSESLLYGHINEMYNYAGLDKKDFIYFPIMEHGIQFYMQTKKNHPPRIFQGEYFLDEWRKEYVGNPYYVIGPYIHYARPYYDKETFDRMKSELGKTLVIFPTHTYELAESKYNATKFVDYVMDTLAKDFDSVVVCSYWADLDHEINKLFSDRGAKIVSAGFRGDYNFIRRLRTIIELSDSVAANSLGTFLGYSIYLKKPVIMFNGDIVSKMKDISVSEQMSSSMKDIENDFMKIFSLGKESFSEEQISLCNPYWGFDKIKTPEEIAAIFQVNKMIIKRAHGSIKNIGKAAQKVYKNAKLSEIQHRILKEALAK